MLAGDLTFLAGLVPFAANCLFFPPMRDAILEYRNGKLVRYVERKQINQILKKDRGKKTEQINGFKCMIMNKRYIKRSNSLEKY